jgi:hypothetical protein
MRSRIEHLESVFTGHSIDARLMPHDGISASHHASAGVDPHREPFLWKPEKRMQLPPFLQRLLGVSERSTHPNVLFDVMPESTTWKCHPEPLILSVNWNAGGSDEFYRFEQQSFSIVRITEPNSGHISCSASYNARLVASGRAKTFFFRPPVTPYQGNAGFFTTSSQFKIVLRGAQGSILGGFTSPSYHIDCQDNFWFIQDWDFNAGLYDLITGATWEVVGAQSVSRC